MARALTLPLLLAVGIATLVGAATPHEPAATVGQRSQVVVLLASPPLAVNGAAQFQLSEPMSFYIAPRTGQAQPPSAVSPQQVREWSAETEIDPKTGATRRGGTAFVVAVPATDERTANAQRDKLRDSGYPAEVARVGDRHEVRIAALADASEAAVLAEQLRRFGYKQAQPGK